MAEPIQQPPTAADLQAVADLYQRYPFLFPGMDPRNNVTVAEVIARYRAGARDEVGERTWKYIDTYLQSFGTALGARPVGTCSPTDLKDWMTANARRMRSGWTKTRVNRVVQRVFNWAVNMRLIRENPFRGLKLHVEKKPGRDMKPEEFQAILRHTDPYFRRFLIALKLTGARPGELRALKWSHIDWHRGLAILDQHKMGRKTGKNRLIILVPQVLKLLAIIKRDQHGPAAVELLRILKHAPNRTVRAKEVAQRMKQLGFSYRSIYRARKAIGAVLRRVGGWSENSYRVYELPEEAAEVPPAHDYVFTSSARHQRWSRVATSDKFNRLRKRIGLPADCKLYGTRHFFATWAVKRGVNLKAIATLLGHTSTVMVEKVYAHIDGDYEFLQKAAQAATALRESPQPLPLPTDAAGWQAMLLTKYPRAAPRPAKKKRPAKRLPNDAEKLAYQALQFAIREQPELASATDATVYEWLIGRREFAGQLPPSLPTFRRYLNTARRHFEGAGKRKKRRLTSTQQQQTPTAGS